MVLPLVAGALIGGAISGGASLIAGSKNRKAQAETNAINVAEARRAAEQNYEWQKEFAQQGLKWKVQDAKRAGVHPLAALGAQTSSFSPSYVGATSQAPDYSDIAQAGQDIGRAVSAASNQYERTAQELTLTKMGLENELLASQIARLRQPATGPAFPGSQHLLEGQGNSPIVGEVKIAPSEPTSAVADGTIEAGVHPDIAFTKTTDGGYAVSPSSSSKQLIEDMTISEWQWAIRNQILPAFGFNRTPPPIQLPDGSQWVFDMWRGAYYPQKSTGIPGVYY